MKYFTACGSFSLFYQILIKIGTTLNVIISALHVCNDILETDYAKRFLHGHKNFFQRYTKLFSFAFVHQVFIWISFDYKWFQNLYSHPWISQNHSPHIWSSHETFATASIFEKNVKQQFTFTAKIFSQLQQVVHINR